MKGERERENRTVRYAIRSRKREEKGKKQRVIEPRVDEKKNEL